MEISRRKRIFQNVAPAILANACVFLFSVVDGVFVGNGAGSQALGAVNLALPFVLLAQALNAMASIGGVTFTAIRFGRGDKAGAQSAFMHSLTLNLLAGILITLAGSVCTGAVCSLLGASESYLPLVREYVCWYALFAIPNALSLNLQSFCRNDGSPGLVAVTNVVSTALNIFLDWLFVFPLQMGVMGAAVATGLSQTAGALIALTHFLFGKGSLRIRRFSPRMKLFRKILFRGLPEAIAQFSTPVTTLCMNRTLMAFFGDTGINAFAIISYLSSFTMAVFFGASEGMQPLFGQAYGAREGRRIRELLGYAVCTAAVFGLVWTALAESAPNLFVRIFMTPTDEILRIAPGIIRKYGNSFLLLPFNIFSTYYFQALMRPSAAFTVSVSRGAVVSGILIFLLPAIVGADSIWYAMPITELLAAVYAAVMMKRCDRALSA